LKGFHRRQIETKQKKAEEEFKRDLEHQAKAQALLDHQEKNFYSYAEQALKTWQDQGKNVKPLILELKNYKKQIV
jgi:predicted TIM-barrel fold metal-dependent hydrolase